MLFRTLRAFVLIVAALATGACGEALAPVAPPADQAYIRGVVTTVDADRVLVEGESPLPEHPLDRAWVTIPREATLRWYDGRSARSRDVVPGRVVTVWVTGAELRSYPVQVTAVYIALER